MQELINIISYICGAFNLIFLHILIALCFPKLSILQRIIIALTSFSILWLFLINCNPYDIDTDKFTILSYIPDCFKPKQTMLSKGINAIHRMKFPVVIKPTICSKVGKDVYVCKDGTDLFQVYQHLSNSGELEHFMAQEYVEDSTELGVLVEKYPWEKYVHIVSITEKLGNAEVRKHCHAGNCKDRKDLIPKIKDSIKLVSACIPNFNVGRYDIRTTENKASKGMFSIVEANGTMGFDLRAWSTPSIIKAIYYHERWFVKRLFIGYMNILLWKGYGPIKSIIIMLITTYNALRCMDWEKLFTIYS